MALLILALHVTAFIKELNACRIFQDLELKMYFNIYREAKGNFSPCLINRLISTSKKKKSKINSPVTF